MSFAVDELVCIGEVAVFYVPIDKLDNELLDFDPRIGGQGKKSTPRQIFHDFFMENYNAYTMEHRDVRGFWRRHEKSRIFQDKNARYEVSFDGGEEKVKRFVSFLSYMCFYMMEESIYLTMGRKSYLVSPKRPINEI